MLADLYDTEPKLIRQNYQEMQIDSLRENIVSS